MTVASRAPASQRRRNGRRLLVWGLRVAMALVFVVAGVMKLAAAREMVAVFNQVGLGQWLRLTVGLCELAGGLLLLVPRLGGAAALGLIGVVIAAGMTEVVFMRQVPWMAVICFLALAVIAWCERDATRRLLGEGK